MTDIGLFYEKVGPPGLLKGGEGFERVSAANRKEFFLPLAHAQIEGFLDPGYEALSWAGS